MAEAGEVRQGHGAGGMGSEEQPVWSGSPSQVVNFGTFVLCGLFCWLVVPIFIALWRWLETRNTIYTLTTERLKIRSGILNRKSDDLELYRVRDYRVEQPFFLRLFSLGDVALETSDKTHPRVVIRAVADADALRDALRTHVEACRVKKRVREIDIE